MKLSALAIAPLLVMALCPTLHASECDITLPTSTDLPEWLNPIHGFVWVGSPALAARVPGDGHWTAMGAAHDFRDKWWWWRDGYQAISESQPELTVTARRLDVSAPPVSISDATNALGRDHDDLMLLMMEFPTEGCWEVIGKYRDQELRFVFEVSD